jgi:hypothetical protein
MNSEHLSSTNKIESRLSLAKGQRFGRENFSLTRPVNGLYFKLLLSSLGGSGKWPSLLNRLISDSALLRSKQLSRLTTVQTSLLLHKNNQTISKSFQPIRFIGTKRKLGRLSRLSLNVFNVGIKKVMKKKLTERAAANLIRQHKLGRSIKFHFSKLVANYHSLRSRLDHQLVS